MERVWLVRAGKDGEFWPTDRDHGVVVVGWPEVPDLEGATSREEIADAVEAAYPELAETTRSSWVGQLQRFRNKMAVGDLVVTPPQGARTVAIGRVTGDYAYRHDLPAKGRHARPVTWLRTDLARSEIGQDLWQSMTAWHAVAQISRNEAAARIARLAETGKDPGPSVTGRRAWLVRGANVDGVDLVPTWLAQGWVSLAASQLPALEADSDPRELRELVAEAYRHKSYSMREKLLAGFDAFLYRMKEGDYLLTVDHGRIHRGLIDGPFSFAESDDRRSNMRRPVRWLAVEESPVFTDLAAPLPALLASQDDVIDLTDGLDEIERLYAPLLSEQIATKEVALAELRPVTDELADELLIDRGWLDSVVGLLAERRQVILYGPPGTGKTYLARRLARHLTETHAVRLVQFHPSYTYEDFFEGFRPRSAPDGRLEFDLRPGAFKELAEQAAEHRSTAYILIIDEINRGNLAKIFGELYFLLEYRDESIRLQYSQVDFTLPPNVYLIGTMNTADRSIAMVDVAMRRRFAFVELHPGRPPIAGLLERWLKRHEIDSDAGRLLDELNAGLADSDYAIGPSYLMREELYRRPDGIESVWRHDILPLLVEHHYADGVDVEARYGLPALRQ
jgi:5-methylcytosine-specific restriction protein B